MYRKHFLDPTPFPDGDVRRGSTYLKRGFCGSETQLESFSDRQHPQIINEEKYDINNIKYTISKLIMYFSVAEKITTLVDEGPINVLKVRIV